MICPYCHKRPITMTLCTDEGDYSCCYECGMAWGVKAKAFAQGADVRLLEWMWLLPEVEEPKNVNPR